MIHEKGQLEVEAVELQRLLSEEKVKNASLRESLANYILPKSRLYSPSCPWLLKLYRYI